ncbi:MAG TPA: AsmA family protein [Casimicrobiaceae bacterium]|jgi:uncharacterized protein involved in outer membrane biogenesis|nr:AsmA family protein [Casimicrobiaceae bacterium]
MSRRALIFLTLLGIVAIAVAAFEWNWLRGPVASYLSAKLERPVKIDGDLHVDLWKQFSWKPFSWKPLVTAEFVSIGNASWGSEDTMARARRMTILVDLESAWKRPIAVPELRLVEPWVLLERNADGAGNWEFKSSGEAPPRLDRLIIEDGVVHFRNPSTGTDFTVNVASSATDENGATPVEFKGTGRLRNNPFAIEGSAASLLKLEDQSKPYRLNVHARAGYTSASFDGTVIPHRIDNVDGRLTLQGRDMSELYPIIPVPFVWTPQYRVSGELTHANAIWSFRKFTGKVGDSDLAGNFVFDGRAERPVIDADLVSQRLDYKDLGGFVGLPPGKESGSARTPEQNREVAKREESGRVLPTRPYDLERLRVVDGTVRFKGKRFTSSPQLPLDDVKMTLVLDHGIVSLQPVVFGVAGGHVVSTLVMDASRDVIKTSGDVTVQNLELKDIVPKLKPPNGSAGKLDGRARFTAAGNSVADMLGSSNGELAFTNTGGDMSELGIVLTNLDLGRAIPLLMVGDKSSPLNCVVADFTADNGRLTAKSFVIDTAAEKIDGEGNIDFAKENYDIKLKAESKRASLVALRGPIRIEGSFKSTPQIHPELGQAVVRAGAAVGLGVLAPPAAILPLMETGGAKDADCGALTQEAQANVEKLPKPVPPKAKPTRLASAQQATPSAIGAIPRG